MPWLTQLALAALIPALVAGCGVPKNRHNTVLTELATSQEKLLKSERDRIKKTKHIQRLEDELGTTQVERDKKDAADREKRKRIAEKELRIEELLKDMKATRAQLLKVQEQQARSEQRLAAFRALNQRFRQLVSSGALAVSFRNGQMVLQLPSEVLFASGRAVLSKPGQTALGNVVEVLKAFPDRRFLVAGHTDDRKIRSRRFKSNWHLSTARAVSVVQFMVGAGFAAGNLGAAGYGSFDPVAANDTPENMAKNRRIEIILVPDLSELPTLDDPS